jgi:hypothetical protein
MLSLLCGRRELSAQPAVVLTNAVDVLALPAERVSLRGVVTAAEKYWGGRFFIQDASGGVFNRPVWLGWMFDDEAR